MRIVIPGGSGQLGGILARELRAGGHEVQILSRSAEDPRLRWDGRSDGEWFEVIDGADAVINLTGRSVNCRYTWANLNEMMSSRLDSTLAVGRAIAAAQSPPPVWIQASTASMYAHTHGAPHDELHGEFGGHEDGVPDYWAYSCHIGRAWELALASCHTPGTRKVALRTGFTMSPDADGVFDWLCWLVRVGWGGAFCGGEQYISWISGRDLAAAVIFLLERKDLDGPFNLCAPEPIPNREFMARLRAELGVSVGLPVASWMATIGAYFLQTDPELMRKSRRVVPRLLLEAGFEFQDATWSEAVGPMVRRWAERRETGRLNPVLGSVQA